MPWHDTPVPCPASFLWHAHTPITIRLNFAPPLPCRLLCRHRYVELSIDVTTNPAVSYIVRMVQGATRSMVIDHAYLLEGQYAHELPEVLVGAIRFKHLDMTDFTHIQTQQELPFSPVVPGVVGR